MKKVFLTFAALTLMATISLAQTKWKMDGAHAWVNFSVMHQGLSFVNGSFSKFDATIEANSKDLKGAKLTASIDPASVNSGVERRDKHLRSQDFFDVKKYPKATFVSKKFKKAGKNKYKIVGDFTLKGVTKEVTMDAKVLGNFETKKGSKMGIHATTTINRYDYGISYAKGKNAPNGKEALASDIKITINMEFTSKK
ncbi:YceI family protein [Microscilla marina]|uniref:YceI n=1 Tax=Microscilla marina ATCC 23134 TaxID=313606 RepID=A2A0B6_MICM2|nr:YceI family protein [Microscilla marina]EAY23932.1 YceI [Microscilla marina ATCC 23134]